MSTALNFDNSFESKGGRPMSRLGQMLKEARGKKGLELSDIAASTHVRKEYLSALEDGRFEDLPENVYSRNFLRLYAEAVGADERALLEQYSQERYGTPDNTRKANQPVASSKPKSPVESVSSTTAASSKAVSVPRERRSSPWLPILLTLALLSVAGVWFWRNYVYYDSNGNLQFTLPWSQQVGLNNPDDPATANTNTAANSTNATNPNSTSATNNSANITRPTGPAGNNAGSAAGSSTNLPNNLTTPSASSLAVADTDNTNSATNTANNPSNTPSSAIFTTDTANPATINSATTSVPDALENPNQASGEAATTNPLPAPTGANSLAALPDANPSPAVGPTLNPGSLVTPAETDILNPESNTPNGFVMLSVVTDPPGASISLDNYDLGLSPLEIPISPGENKVVSASLEGYEAVRDTIDLSGERLELSYDLTPIGETAEGLEGAITEVSDTASAAAPSAGKVKVRIEGEAWLEIYQGTTRGGERLVYKTAQAGENFEFDLPVYIRAGNSDKVLVNVDGSEVALGGTGQVTGKAFE
ncbi:MAG: DUF4115 domain-containing protein [Deinococcales bacterium]